MVHIWSQKERHGSHIMRDEMGLDWPDIVRICRQLWNAEATVKLVRDDYNNREKAGRSQMWANHIVKQNYTAQEQQDRAAVRADIINAANALGINIPNTNAPASAALAPPAAPGVQPAPTLSVQGPSNIVQAAQTVLPHTLASPALSTTTLPTVNPASTYTTNTTVPSHGLASRFSTPAKRSAPGSSISRRLGSKFVLAGHPDPSEQQDTSEPPAKKPATAERVNANRALPSVNPAQQPNTVASDVGIDFIFGGASQASPAAPQLNINVGPAEAVTSGHRDAMSVAHSLTTTTRNSQVVPSAGNMGVFNNDTSLGQIGEAAALPSTPHINDQRAAGITALRRYLIGDSASGLTAFSRMSIADLEAWLQKHGVRPGAGAESVVSEYGSVRGGIQDYAHPTDLTGNVLNVRGHSQRANAGPVLKGTRGGDEMANVSEEMAGEDDMALSEEGED